MPAPLNEMRLRTTRKITVSLETQAAQKNNVSTTGQNTVQGVPVRSVNTPEKKMAPRALPVRQQTKGQGRRVDILQGIATRPRRAPRQKQEESTTQWDAAHAERNSERLQQQTARREMRVRAQPQQNPAQNALQYATLLKRLSAWAGIVNVETIVSPVGGILYLHGTHITKLLTGKFGKSVADYAELIALIVCDGLLLFFFFVAILLIGLIAFALTHPLEFFTSIFSDGLSIFWHIFNPGV